MQRLRLQQLRSVDRHEPVDQESALAIAHQLGGEPVADRLETAEAALAHVPLPLGLLDVEVVQDLVLVQPLVVDYFVVRLRKVRFRQLPQPIFVVELIRMGGDNVRRKPDVIPLRRLEVRLRSHLLKLPYLRRVSAVRLGGR